MTDDTAPAVPTMEAVPDLTMEDLDRMQKHLRNVKDFFGDVKMLGMQADALLSMARRTVQAEQKAKDAEAERDRLLANHEREMSLMEKCTCETRQLPGDTDPLRLTFQTVIDPACPVHGEEAG